MYVILFSHLLIYKRFTVDEINICSSGDSYWRYKYTGKNIKHRNNINLKWLCLSSMYSMNKMQEESLTTLFHPPAGVD